MTRKAPTCQICKAGEALWAMQYVGEAAPTFTTLGSHYRGFPVTKVCDGCKAEMQATEARHANGGLP